MPLALVISPIRTWPLDQGNRIRVLTMGRMLRERGYGVHFLLSELEGTPNPSELAEMSRQWDLVKLSRYDHARRSSYADAWGGDDWYPLCLDGDIVELTRTWSYDLCFVNYAWYSKAFGVLPKNVTRIIDTHDAFGDRHKRLYAAGTSPEWYYTRPEDEGRCLDRADIVISIQDEEKRWFEALTDKPILTVGHVVPPLFLPPSISNDGPIRIGYMGSANPSNRSSIRQLLEAWEDNNDLMNTAELHLAGPICSTIPRDTKVRTVRHGFVPDPSVFFDRIDIAINPNIGGSGLKIKSVEALAYGRPTFATREAMIGLHDVAPPYVVEDITALVQAISTEIQTDPKLEAARAWARRLFLSYRKKQIAAFEALIVQAMERSRAPCEPTA